MIMLMLHLQMYLKFGILLKQMIAGSINFIVMSTLLIQLMTQPAGVLTHTYSMLMPVGTICIFEKQNELKVDINSTTII